MSYPNPYSVLVIGKNKEILDVLLRVINSSQEYVASIYLYTDKISTFSLENFDIILLSSGLSVNDEMEIEKQISTVMLNAKVIQHYGGGSGLLFAEFKQALAS